MSLKKSDHQIEIHGAREHNLKDVSLKIPRGAFVVVTGLSGSGKSSLVFDTLYAEGYRKYLSCLSTHARQDLQKISQPDVDYIRGLSPVVAIEQHAGGQSGFRNTVGSITEIASYARLLWSSMADVYCPNDGALVERRSLEDCIGRIFDQPEGSKIVLMAHVLNAKKAEAKRLVDGLKQRGYNRVCIDSNILLIDEIDWKKVGSTLSLDVVVDRLKIAQSARSRIADSLELAFKEGKNKAIVWVEKDGVSYELLLNQDWSCAECAEGYSYLTQKSFSANHVDGACKSCSGMGVKMQFVPELVVSDASKSIEDGALKPLRLGSRLLNIRNKSLFRQLSEQLPFDLSTPWEDLDLNTRRFLMHGSKTKMFQFKYPRRKMFEASFSGAIEMLDHMFVSTSNETLRARLMAYQKSVSCDVCGGEQLNPLSRAAKFEGLRYPEFISMNVGDALNWISEVSGKRQWSRPVSDAFKNIYERLYYLRELGLPYLNLNRSYSSLSGGEAQRVRLATQLGLGMLGLLYVLDEPSIGLHPRDNQKLLNALLELKKKGNSLIVVEHDESLMQYADYLVEVGPGAGEKGGCIMFSGTLKQCIKSKKSLTGGFLSGRERIEKEFKDKDPEPKLKVSIKGAAEHNLKNINVSFPVGLFTAVCGVSGSGKSTLVLDILAKAGLRKLNKSKTLPGKHKSIEGLSAFEKIICVDASPIGKSPRSNPATFIKLFDLLRDIFSQCALSRVRGYKPGRFSFNVKGGRCERCQGDGAIKVSMQFLGDTFSSCPSCEGSRYNRETLEVEFKGHSIADVLAMTVDEAASLFEAIPKIKNKLSVLQDVGLGYLRLGQASNTLSGGEAQRIKLSLELSKRQSGQNLYILDEPTTGLHSSDIQKLLNLLFKLRDAGNTVIVIEHHTDVISLSDWVVELGPEGGNAGGAIIFEGKPADLKKCKDSPTGACMP